MKIKFKTQILGIGLLGLLGGLTACGGDSTNSPTASAKPMLNVQGPVQASISASASCPKQLGATVLPNTGRIVITFSGHLPDKTSYILLFTPNTKFGGPGTYPIISTAIPPKDKKPYPATDFTSSASLRPVLVAAPTPKGVAQPPAAPPTIFNYVAFSGTFSVEPKGRSGTMNAVYHPISSNKVKGDVTVSGTWSCNS